MMDFSAIKVTCSSSEKFHTNKQKTPSLCKYKQPFIQCAKPRNLHLHVGGVKWFDNAFTWPYVNFGVMSICGF